MKFMNSINLWHCIRKISIKKHFCHDISVIFRKYLLYFSGPFCHILWQMHFSELIYKGNRFKIIPELKLMKTKNLKFWTFYTLQNIREFCYSYFCHCHCFALYFAKKDKDHLAFKTYFIFVYLPRLKQLKIARLLKIPYRDYWCEPI